MGSSPMISAESSRMHPHPLLITAVSWLDDDRDRPKLIILLLSLSFILLHRHFFFLGKIIQQKRDNIVAFF